MLKIYLADFYVLIPFKIIKSNFISNVYWYILLNGTFIEGEHEKITKINEKNLIIKYSIENKEIEIIKEDVTLRYKAKNNSIDIKNYNLLNIEIKKYDVLRYMKEFFDVYNNCLKKYIEKIDNIEIRDHLIHFIIDYKLWKEINIEVKIIENDFENYMKNDFIIKDVKEEEKRYYKKLIENNKIIYTKYDEYELLFWYLPLLIGFYISINVESLKFNSLINNISTVLSHSLSFSKDEEEKEKNYELFYSIITNSINQTFEHFKEKEIEEKRNLLNDILNN